MVSDQVLWLGTKAHELLAEYEQMKPTARLISFQQVEDLWSRVVLPELPRFETMKSSSDPVPADSPWAVNWEIKPFG